MPDVPWEGEGLDGKLFLIFIVLEKVIKNN